MLVVMYHIVKKGVVAGDFPINFFEFGQFGVEIFFIISGFIMAFITAGREFQLSSFIARRAVRILPMYWLFTTVALCALVAIPRLAFTHSEAPPGLLTSYLLIPDPDHALLLMVGWTLSYELLFYSVFSLMGGRSGWPVMGVLAALWGLSFVVPHSFYLQFVFNDFWAEFLAGMVLFRLRDRRRALLAVGVAALAVFCAFAWHGMPERRSIYFGLPALSVFSMILAMEGALRQWRSTALLPVLKFLGDASYSIYLSHVFALNLTFVAIYKIVEFDGEWGGAIYMVASLVFSVVVGGLIHVFVEKKILHLLRNIGAPAVKASPDTPSGAGPV